jgi:hypothetical protein
MARSKVFIPLRTFSAEERTALGKTLKGEQAPQFPPPHVRVGPWTNRAVELFRNGELKHSDLVSLLAVLEAQALNQGANDALVPVEIIAIIGEKLSSKSEWAARQNRARKDLADSRSAQLQRKADEIWKDRPGLSLSRVANKLVTDPAMRATITIYRKNKPEVMKAATVSKLITRPGK